MSNPYRLSLVITHADGTETRWGPDELDAGDVPSNLTFTTSIPGGFSDLQCDLLRRIDQDRGDMSLMDAITVYGPGGQIVWEGRWQQFPRQTSDGYTVSPGGEGWVAHLRDNKTFRQIYVDRDLSQWGPASTSMKVNDAAGGYITTDPSVVPDSTNGSPSLRTAVSGITMKPTCKAYYNAHGLSIGSVYYAWKKDANVNNADTNWSWAVQIWAADDGSGSSTSSGELRAAGPGTGTVTAAISNPNFARIDFVYQNTSATADGNERGLYWTCLAVYGNHGLTLRGTGTATAAQGVYASDVIAHALSQAAPLANYSTGASGSIQPTYITLEQLAFTSPTTVEEVVKACNAYHLWDWGFEEGRTFFWRPSDPNRLTWTVRLGDGAHLKDDGVAAADIINGVVVSYQDPSGQQRFAGPTTATGMNVTDSSLQDSSLDNIATAHGVTQKWDLLELSRPSTDANAVDIGAIYLAERSVPQHRGEAVITGLVQHPTEGLRPSWAIRAGDYVQFTDVNDDSIGQPRRIIATSYDHQQRSNTLSLDSTPYTLDALLALLDAQLTNF